MGFPPMQDRLAWYAASPIAHATFANNNTAFLLAYGTHDDIVDPGLFNALFFGGMGRVSLKCHTPTQTAL